MADASSKNLLANEREIVDRAKTDERAFEILYSHYFSRIYGYVFKRTGHHETCEDIVSLTFTKAFGKLATYEHKGYSFGSWLYRIATNNVIDYYRKKDKSKYVDIEAIAEPASNEQTAEKGMEREYDSQIVRKIIATLETSDQELINLKFFAELNNQEIAETLDITPNNAGVRIFRAIKKFDTAYKKHAK